MVKLWINNIDASTFGCSLGDGGLVALMTPASNKAYIENKNDGSDGKQILCDNTTPALVDERDVTLQLNIYGRTQNAMLANYRTLVGILKAGKVDIKTDFEPNVVYHLYYQQCTQMRSFFNHCAIFNVKFNEPNPTSRT